MKDIQLFGKYLSGYLDPGVSLTTVTSIPAATNLATKSSILVALHLQLLAISHQGL
jgi:hypothetical protein